MSDSNIKPPKAITLKVHRHGQLTQFQEPTVLEALESICRDQLFGEAFPESIEYEGKVLFNRDELLKAWPDYAHYLEDRDDANYNPSKWFDWVNRANILQLDIEGQNGV